MQFLSLQPFVPSGKDFERSKQLFLELGFDLIFDYGDLAGFENGNCKFMLQHYDQKEFAENFMISVRVTDVAAFRKMAVDKDLMARFGISIGEIKTQPYGKEVNLIDIAGVCWHFIE